MTLKRRLPPLPRIVRPPRASAEEVALLDLHKADASYASIRTQLTRLFGRASKVLVEAPARHGPRNVTLTPAELGLLNDVLRFDQAEVIE
jgi:hypothetical protein